MRTAIRTASFLLALAVALVIAGCGGSSDGAAVKLSDVKPNVSGADPRLVKISDQSSKVLAGGEPAFKARLSELKGLPVVVNKWASWCGPCIAEAGYYQQAAKQLGGEVAFLGVDVSDTSSGAARFLRKHPVAFPSYADPDNVIGATIPPAKSQPVTQIYNADGKLVHIKGGPYGSTQELVDDITRFAGPLKTAGNS